MMSSNIKHAFIGFFVGVISTFFISIYFSDKENVENNETYLIERTKTQKEKEILNLRIKELSEEVSKTKIDTVFLEADKVFKKHDKIKKETNVKKDSYINSVDSIKLVIFKHNISN